MARQKRRPGGGRKPKGPIREKRETFSTRITAGTRQALEREAERAGQSISQVAERLLWSGLEARNRSRTMIPIRAISFLFERLALAACGASIYRDSGWLENRINAWRVDPFSFRAFKLAVGMLLDYLEPQGPAISMFDARRMRTDIKTAEISREEWHAVIGRYYETPEIYGAYIFSRLLRELHNEQPTDWRGKFMDGPSFLTEPATSDLYGFRNARRDLGFGGPEASE
jgi:hypothetical protein